MTTLTEWLGRLAKAIRKRAQWESAARREARNDTLRWAAGILRDQCAAAGVAFHWKQWGEWAPGDFGARGEAMWMHRDGTVMRHQQRPQDPFDAAWVPLVRVGKKAAGRLLDGREHNGVPGGAA